MPPAPAPGRRAATRPRGAAAAAVAVVAVAVAGAGCGSGPRARAPGPAAEPPREFRAVWVATARNTGRFAKDGRQIPRQIEAARRLLGPRAAGHVHFSARALLDDEGGLVAALRPLYGGKARVPDMPWLERRPAPAPPAPGPRPAVSPAAPAPVPLAVPDAPPMPAAPADTNGAPRRDVEARIAARLRSFRGILGVAARDLTTGETVLVNADARFPTASAIKTAVMVEVFHQIAEGRLGRSTPVTLTEGTKVGGSGVLRRLHGGLALTVADLVWLMMTVSDNTATNLLVDLVGTRDVDRRLAAYGLVHTKLHRATFRQGRPEISPETEREFGLGVTTPRELARLMALIAEGRIVSRAASDEMMEIMRAEAFRAMIPRGIPSEEGLLVANKPGWDEEKLPDARGARRHVRVDAAIVTSPRHRYVVAACARQVEDTRFSVDNEANVAIAEVARLVHEGFSARDALTDGRAR